MSAWKERGLRRLAPLASELVMARFDRPEVDVITYIPPDPVRQLRRSCHPAQSLSVELARQWNLGHRTLLARLRTGTRQAALPYTGRRANVQGAFGATAALRGRVLLVDDVYTTGATASAAASALRQAGASSVEVITFARAVR
jgi:predicted amidophosphoribosyltransferase